ncbi:hypothetical protein CBL_12403 [Carabus blaptoides fortunei]
MVVAVGEKKEPTELPRQMTTATRFTSVDPYCRWLEHPSRILRAVGIYATFKSRLWVLRQGTLVAVYDPLTGLQNWQSIPRSAGQSASFNSRPFLFVRTYKLHPSPDREPLRYAYTSSFCTLHLLTHWNIFCLLLLSSSPPPPDQIVYEVIGQYRKSVRLFLRDLCSVVGH